MNPQMLSEEISVMECILCFYGAHVAEARESIKSISVEMVMNVGQTAEMVEMIKRNRLKNSIIKYTKLVLGWIIRKLEREDYLWIIVKK